MNLDRSTSGSLSNQLQQGDESAFETIFQLYYRELFMFARRSVPTKEDCEEMVQDVFVSLWNNRQQKVIENIEGYLFNAIRYRIIHYFRHIEVKKRYADHFRIFHVLYESGDQLEMEPSEASILIQRCIEDLPKRYRETIKLRLEEELSNEDIAKRLMVNKRTVEDYFSKAVELLRINLRSKGKSFRASFYE